MDSNLFRIIFIPLYQFSEGYENVFDLNKIEIFSFDEKDAHIRNDRVKSYRISREKKFARK